MSKQRKPTDAERDHLTWVHETVGKICATLGPVPHEIALKIEGLAGELEAAAFDPFGEILSSCEHCEALILTCDEDCTSSDDGWFCGNCVRSFSEDAQ